MKTCLPTISVVLPTYNNASFLSEAIDSIIEQSFEDWELIIINDGSTDRTHEIITTYRDLRIKYIKCEKNVGIVRSLNLGIESATGRYIARMDGDDIARRTRFEKQIEFLENNPDIDIVGSWVSFINEKGQTISGSWAPPKTNEDIKVQLLFGCPISHPSCIFRSKVFKEYTYSDNFNLAEDYDLFSRIMDSKKAVNLPYYLLKYRRHADNDQVVKTEKQKELHAKIFKRELEKLDCQLTSSSLKTYTDLFYYNNQKYSIIDLNRINFWFKQIIIANESKSRFNHKFLRTKLSDRYLEYALRSDNVILGFVYFTYSSLITDYVSLLSILRLLVSAIERRTRKVGD